ncbi:MAG: Spx/MgsR family RNA polymerase-binding regulatory protein [Traorella sp.]
MQFIGYRKCSTCSKAKKYLESLNVDFVFRDIQEKVTIEELKKWITISNKNIDKFFNTSGLIYRNENYKERLKIMSEDEKLHALSENPMLVKRPLLIGDNFVLVGFKEEEYRKVGEIYGQK